MLTVLVVFVLLIIALLAIPVTLSFSVFWLQTFQGYIKLQWLFGLVRLQLPALLAKSTTVDDEKLANIIGRFDSSVHKKKKHLAIIWRKGFRQRIIRFVNDFWRAIHKQDIDLRIRIGLGDPADTGLLWAFVGPAAGMLSNVQEAFIKIEPEFTETTFELDGSGNIRLIPLQMIFLIVGLLLSPPVWQGIKQMRTVE